MDIKLYIKKSSTISLLEENISSNTFELIAKQRVEKNFLHVNEPDYKEYLKMSTIRRASRYTKIGMYAALKTIENEGKIDGVIVATGFGGLFHSEICLLEMIDGNESGVSPNPFFQSLHSSLSGNIAIHCKCHAYNMTYVNRGNTFESALLDAFLHVQENKDYNILVGGSDEITEKYTDIVKRSNYLTNGDSENSAYVLGEGATFFMLTGERTENGIAIEAIKALFDVVSEIAVSKLLEMCTSLDIEFSEIDLIISGHQNDNELREALSFNKTLLEKDTIFYKNYIGEYPTSTAYALWLAEKILDTNLVPLLFNIKRKNTQRIKRILIFNQYKKYTSMLIISKL